MGCDIELHSEIRVGGVWYHYSYTSFRDYRVFDKIAGVRCENIIPVARPRGLPDDLSVTTAIAAAKDSKSKGSYSHGWLSAAEITSVQQFIEHEIYEDDASKKWRLEQDYWGCYFFGGDFGHFSTHRDEYPPLVDDLRFVFWFN